ncbi:hypothetical protein GCM10025771_03620 [Niveibacterium umoris]|uniref:DUF7482 domain-containing protein n=1 Tax=Niveibacterium umoris TaxID=1193620 RepID=A0A840BTF8_9RHOO|nr:hypothetical protein [Niveibacterium umoris]MBB4014096.1 hypothetical protein [Niveibacterium umoris]
MSCRPGFRACASPLLALLLTACGSAPPSTLRASIPVTTGWFDGRPVYYLTTDISDPAMAAMAKVNLAPRMANAIPPADTPGRSAIDRVYKFDPPVQASVLPSAPEPLGATSRSTAYSPIWRVWLVRWKPGATPRVLRSEADVLAADDAGEIQLSVTDIIVNCPVIGYDGHWLPGVEP